MGVMGIESGRNRNKDSGNGEGVEMKWGVNSRKEVTNGIRNGAK